MNCILILCLLFTIMLLILHINLIIYFKLEITVCIDSTEVSLYIKLAWGLKDTSSGVAMHCPYISDVTAAYHLDPVLALWQTPTPEIIPSIPSFIS